jgi:hypothetical protein
MLNVVESSESGDPRPYIAMGIVSEAVESSQV